MRLAPRGASEGDLEATQLPADLRAFLAEHDGGQGTVGKRPLQLWSAAQIAREAESQEVSLAVPGLLLFGTDGGAEGYGFLERARRGGRYGRISLLAAGAHEFEPLADSFEGLLRALEAGK